MSVLLADAQASVDFLRWWRPGGPWVLTAIMPDRSAIETRTFGEDGIGHMKSWFARHGNRNLYFHVNPTTRDMSKKAEREDIAALAWLHVDIDPRAGEDLDAERTRARELLTTRLPPGIPPPSAVVFSGGGYQGFWRLEEPVPINGQPEAFEDAKRYNIALELAFGADNCHNVDRIMRLPGSVNWPDAKKAKKGRVPTLAVAHELSDASYNIAQFKKCEPPSATTRPLPDLGVEHRGLSERLVAIATHGCHPNEPEKASRSEWVFDFCCNAIRDAVDEETILATLLDARCRISQSVLEHGSRAESYARRQVERARAAVDSGPLCLSRDEPLRSARMFVARRRPTLLRYNGEWLTYGAGAYHDLETDTIKADLYVFLHAAVTISRKDDVPVEQPFCPNRHKVADVLEALNAETHVARETFAPPCWLSGEGPPPDELLACRNGLLHLPSGELLAPTERFFTRNALAFDFDGNAPEPTRWLSFLREVWPGHGAEADVLQEMFGYLLVPDTAQQKIFMIIGPKRSGKGTIGRLLRHLVGRGNMCGLALDELGNNFGMEPLIGKQLVLASDMRAGSKADAAKLAENLLRISGEDEVTIARKYKSSWTGKLNVRFVIMTNEMPAIRDVSGALASRFIPLVMRESFFGREDTTLDAALREELPGILNWAIVGWRRLRERGRFVMPTASSDALRELEGLGSPVKVFLNEACVEAPGGEVSKDQVYRAWTQWCEQNNMHPGGSAQFASQLIAATDGRVRPARLRREDERIPHWLGLELRSCPPPPF